MGGMVGWSVFNVGLSVFCRVCWGVPVRERERDVGDKGIQSKEGGVRRAWSRGV